MRRLPEHLQLHYYALGVLLTLSISLSVESNAADIYAGRSVYEMHCQTCHGEKGRSMDPGTPDFSRSDSLFVSDADLFRRVRNGAGAMPAYRGLLADDEIRDVVAYLRTLQR